MDRLYRQRFGTDAARPSGESGSENGPATGGRFTFEPTPAKNDGRGRISQSWTAFPAQRPGPMPAQSRAKPSSQRPPTSGETLEGVGRLVREELRDAFFQPGG
jgi:hypothetical protein